MSPGEREAWQSAMLLKMNERVTEIAPANAAYIIPPNLMVCYDGQAYTHLTSSFIG